MLTSTFRLDFDQGSQYLALLWDGPNALVGEQFMPEIAPTVLNPTSPSEFVMYEQRDDDGEVCGGKMVVGEKVLAKE
jgi:hypothetical protein